MLELFRSSKSSNGGESRRSIIKKRKSHDKTKKDPSPMIVQIESHADWLELFDTIAWDYDDDGHDDQIDGSDDGVIHNGLIDHGNHTVTTANTVTNVTPNTQIIAVTFTASWCKYCQSFKRKWQRKIVQPTYKQQQQQGATTTKPGKTMKKTIKSPTRATSTATIGGVRQNAKGTAQVQFASVDYGTNRKLCQSLKIHALPTIQFYNGENGDLLTSFPCGPKGFAIAKETFHNFVSMTPQDLEEEATKCANIVAAENTAKTFQHQSLSSKKKETSLVLDVGAGSATTAQVAKSQALHNEAEIMETSPHLPTFGRGIDGAVSSDNDNKRSGNDKDENDSDEPSLYLRKRDRIKQKLSRRRRKSSAKP